MAERIQLRRTKGWRKPEDAIVVARPTKWGNPWPVDEHGLDLSLAMYRNAVRGIWNPHLLRHLGDQAYVRAHDAHRAWRARIDGHPLEVARSELRARDLACWCPLVDEHGQRVPCHADVLLELVNA